MMEDIREGRSLHVHTSISPRASCTLFFLHGSMASSAQFDKLCEALTRAHHPEEFNVVMYDALGCGKSSKPEDSSGLDLYGTNNLYLDAKKIIERYSTPNVKSVVIGHSYGTAMSARLVANRDLVEATGISAAVLLGTTKHIPDGGRTGFLFRLPTFLLGWMQSTLSEQFLQAAFSPSTPESVKNEARQFSNNNEMHVCKSFYNGFQWATDDHWAAIKLPVLIVQGVDDKITPPEGARDLFDSHFKASDAIGVPIDGGGSSSSGSGSGNGSRMVEIEAAGHQIMQEKPEEVAGEIVRFLKDCGVL